MTLHDRFDWHIADRRNSRWDDQGHFVTTCTICGRAMIKPPGHPWRVRDKAD